MWMPYAFAKVSAGFADMFRAQNGTQMISETPGREGIETSKKTAPTKTPSPETSGR
jgi:hypothetical protein